MNFIHEFVPSKTAGRTLLMLHGTGGNEKDLLPLGRALDPNAALLSPRGKVLENGMPRYFRRLAEGVFDLEDLRFRTKELAEFIRAASTEYGIDTSSIVAVGYSNGANIAASIMLLDPSLLHKAVLLRPMVPFEPEQPPKLNHAEVFISAGRRDQIIPALQTQRLVELLESSGAKVAMHWHPGGHELGQDDVDAAKKWLLAS